MGRQAAKSHGPGAQVDSDNRPALRRPAISRRVLLAAGGMMLAECVACQAQDAPSGTPRRPNAPPRADPAGGPGASAMRSSSTGSDSPARAAGQPSAGSTATPQHGGNGVTGEPRSALGRSAYDRPIEHIDDGPRAIALTIDDGPSAFYTPQVLSVLQKYGVTATSAWSVPASPPTQASPARWLTLAMLLPITPGRTRGSPRWPRPRYRTR